MAFDGVSTSSNVDVAPPVFSTKLSNSNLITNLQKLLHDPVMAQAQWNSFKSTCKIRPKVTFLTLYIMWTTYFIL